MPWSSLSLILLLSLAMLPAPPGVGQQQTTPSPSAQAQPLPTPSAPREAPPGRGVLAYYVPYDPASWASLEAQASLIDVVAVQWVTVDACGGLTSQDNQSLKQVARERGLRVFPSLLTFSGWLNSRLLNDEPTSAAAIASIVEYVLAEGYDGFDLDLEAVRSADRDAYTAFVARLGAALHAHGKALSLAVPPKASDTRGGWAGAFDYAALAPHVDLVTIMAYEYSGAWGAPGPVAPYNQVEAALAFGTSQIPPEKVLLGLAFYGYDWNTTSGGGRYLGYPQAAALADRHGVPIALDPASRSATFRYSALGGERPPAVAKPPRPDHLITERQAPPCPIVDPAPTPTPTPRPTPPPEQLQEHVVWLEESGSAAARLGLAERYGARGIATWCLGLEDPLVWPLFARWRQAAT